MKDISAIVNRHMARLLSDLEDAGCPTIFREAVKSKLVWLRSDLTEDTNDKSGGNHARSSTSISDVRG